MKHQTFLYLAMILMAFTFSQCKKDKNEEPQLPPETTIGAMTFGCKVNGKVFVPKDGRGRVGLFAQYVYLGDGPDGGWFLNIPATNWLPNPPEGMTIVADSLLLEDGKTYEFNYDELNFSRIKGAVYSGYRIGSNGYIKTSSDTGSLRITKFDKVNRIVSGTFSYSATDLSTGNKIQVTEGRFDIRF